MTRSLCKSDIFMTFCGPLFNVPVKSTALNLGECLICSFITHQDALFCFPTPLLRILYPSPNQMETKLTRMLTFLNFFLLAHPLSTHATTILDGINGTVCNAQQYQQSQPSDGNPIPLISCLTHGQTTGLTVRIHPLLPVFIS